MEPGGKYDEIVEPVVNEQQMSNRKKTKQAFIATLFERKVLFIIVFFCNYCKKKNQLYQFF